MVTTTKFCVTSPRNVALLSLFQSFNSLIPHKPVLIESKCIEAANYEIGMDTDVVEELILVPGEDRTG